MSDSEHPETPETQEQQVEATSQYSIHSQSDSRFRLPLWAKISLLAFVIGLSGIGYLSSGFWQRHGPKQAQAELDPEEIARRQPVKDFTILDSNGKQHLLSEYRGSVVILSFWASWCTPCLVELPSFADLQKKFKNDGLKVIAVNMDDGDEGQVLAKDFWAKKEFPFPCFFDQTKKLAEQFEVEMLPSNFVIDRKGRLVFSSFGANDWMSAQTTDFLEGLLAEGE